MSTDIVNERRRTVIVLPLSASPGPSPPLLVSIQCAGRPVVAVVDQLRAVAKERLGALVGVASSEEMAAIEDSLRQILEL
jgi:mRNA interferase MazF